MILPPDQLAHSDTSYLIFPDGNDVGLQGGLFLIDEGERKERREGKNGFSLVLFFI